MAGSAGGRVLCRRRLDPGQALPAADLARQPCEAKRAPRDAADAVVEASGISSHS